MSTDHICVCPHHRTRTALPYPFCFQGSTVTLSFVLAVERDCTACSCALHCRGFWQIHWRVGDFDNSTSVIMLYVETSLLFRPPTLNEALDHNFARINHIDACLPCHLRPSFLFTTAGENCTAIVRSSPEVPSIFILTTEAYVKQLELSTDEGGSALEHTWALSPYSAKIPHANGIVRTAAFKCRGEGNPIDLRRSPHLYERSLHVHPLVACGSCALACS
jgi:hypothetical protein